MGLGGRGAGRRRGKIWRLLMAKQHLRYLTEDYPLKLICTTGRKKSIEK